MINITHQRNVFGRLESLCLSEKDEHGELLLAQAMLSRKGDEIIRTIAVKNDESMSSDSKIIWPEKDVRMRAKALHGEHIIAVASKTQDNEGLREGVSFLNQSVEGNDAYAALFFGVMYELGNPCVEKNTEKSRMMFMRSVALGFNDAELLLLPMNWETCSPQNVKQWNAFLRRIARNAIRGECELNGLLIFISFQHVIAFEMTLLDDENRVYHWR